MRLITIDSMEQLGAIAAVAFILNLFIGATTLSLSMMEWFMACLVASIMLLVVYVAAMAAAAFLRRAERLHRAQH